MTKFRYSEEHSASSVAGELDGSSMDLQETMVVSRKDNEDPE